jgi:hypothetical protein
VLGGVLLLEARVVLGRVEGDLVEITVLAVAIIGVAALLRRGRPW